MRLRVLLDSLPIIVYTLDPAGNFTFSDGKALEQLGFRANQVLGRSAFEVYKKFPTIIESLHRSLAGEPNRYENHVGAVVFDNWMMPLFDPSGELVGIFGAALDITDRKQTEAAQDFLQNQVILTGIRPEVAQTLVGLGVGLSGISTLGTLQAGIAIALRQPR